MTIMKNNKFINSNIHLKDYDIFLNFLHRYSKYLDIDKHIHMNKIFNIGKNLFSIEQIIVDSYLYIKACMSIYLGLHLYFNAEDIEKYKSKLISFIKPHISQLILKRHINNIMKFQIILSNDKYCLLWIAENNKIRYNLLNNNKK